MRAHLRIEKGEGRPLVWNLDTERTATLGRSLESTIVLQDEHVSRRHAEIALQDNRWLIRDFDTPNGTRVNGERIEGATILEDGQEIGIGGVTLRFLLGVAENGASTDSAGASTDAELLHLFDPKAATLHAYELSALCLFMSLSVAEDDAQALIARA